MKTNFLVATIAIVFCLCIFSIPSAHAQTAPVLSNNPAPIRMQDHPVTASEHAMAQETTLLSTTPYGYAKGEVPLADLASPMYYTPLGDIARAYRMEHEFAPKAVVVFEEQK